MKIFRTAIIAFIGFAIISGQSCSRNTFPSDSSGQPKNVILLIGDGMGVTQLYAAMSVVKKSLYLESAKFIGFNRTHSWDDYSTDSAAGGTALATGVKTRNGIIGMRADSMSLPNLIELAHRRGLAGGVVSTSSVTHATPAAFVAHNISRNQYEEIATDFLKTMPEVFIGGGYDNFANRRDGANYIPELKEKGYTVVTSVEELLEVDGADRLAGLLAPGHMPAMSDGRGDMLSYASLKAIETLSRNENGYFLMVEASQIDWGGHENNTDYIIREVLDLDRTLGVLLDYAKLNGETLIVVTSDHETGGMALPYGDVHDRSVAAEYTSTGHTGVIVPVFAFGPGADEFTGFYENTDLFKKIKTLLGL
ncbi:MAG: alkaline phosphatase [Bacteroidales bacterium]|nr:alkaline phosphatase [Bacteroidales bacterium]